METIAIETEVYTKEEKLQPLLIKDLVEAEMDDPDRKVRIRVALYAEYKASITTWS